MHDSPSEIERIARHRIDERIGRIPAPVRTPRLRRRTTLARGLRRIADRLDS